MVFEKLRLPMESLAVAAHPLQANCQLPF